MQIKPYLMLYIGQFDHRIHLNNHNLYNGKVKNPYCHNNKLRTNKPKILQNTINTYSINP